MGTSNCDIEADFDIVQTFENSNYGLTELEGIPANNDLQEEVEAGEILDSDDNISTLDTFINEFSESILPPHDLRCKLLKDRLKKGTISKREDLNMITAKMIELTQLRAKNAEDYEMVDKNDFDLPMDEPRSELEDVTNSTEREVDVSEECFKITVHKMSSDMSLLLSESSDAGEASPSPVRKKERSSRYPKRTQTSDRADRSPEHKRWHSSSGSSSLGRYPRPQPLRRTRSRSRSPRVRRQRARTPPRRKERPPFIVEITQKLREKEETAKKRDEFEPPRGMKTYLPEAYVPAVTNTPTHVPQVAPVQRLEPAPVHQHRVSYPYPHVVNHLNQMIPVYLSSDMVLRLPDHQPVVPGPYYKGPFDVDGSYIVLTSDSKPAYHYASLQYHTTVLPPLPEPATQSQPAQPPEPPSDHLPVSYPSWHIPSKLPTVPTGPETPPTTPSETSGHRTSPNSDIQVTNTNHSYLMLHQVTETDDLTNHNITIPLPQVTKTGDLPNHILTIPLPQVTKTGDLSSISTIPLPQVTKTGDLSSISTIPLPQVTKASDVPSHESSVPLSSVTEIGDQKPLHLDTSNPGVQTNRNRDPSTCSSSDDQSSSNIPITDLTRVVAENLMKIFEEMQEVAKEKKKTDWRPIKPTQQPVANCGVKRKLPEDDETDTQPRRSACSLRSGMNVAKPTGHADDEPDQADRSISKVAKAVETQPHLLQGLVVLPKVRTAVKEDPTMSPLARHRARHAVSLNSVTTTPTILHPRTRRKVTSETAVQCELPSPSTHTFEASIKKLEEELSQRNTQHADLTEAFVALKSEHKELQERLGNGKTTREFEEIVKGLTEEKFNLLRQAVKPDALKVQRVPDKWTRATNTCSSLEDTVNSLTEQNKIQLRQMTALQTQKQLEAEDIKKKTQETEKRLTVSKALVKSLQAQVDRQACSIKEWEANVKTQDLKTNSQRQLSAKSQTVGDVGNLKKQVIQLNETIYKKVMLLREVTTERDDLKRASTQEKKEKEEIIKTLQSKTDTLKIATAEHNDLLKAMAVKEKEVTQLKEEKTELAAKVTQLKEEKTELAAKVTKKENVIKQLEVQKKEVMANQAKKDQQIEKLKKNVLNMKEQVKEIQTEKRELIGRYDKKKQLLEDVLSNVDKNEELIGQLEKKIELVRAEQEDQATSKELRVQKLLKEKEELVCIIAEKEKEAIELNAKNLLINTLKNEVSGKESEIKKLKTELKEVLSNNSKLETNIKNLVTTNETKVAQLEKLMNELVSKVTSKEQLLGQLEKQNQELIDRFNDREAVWVKEKEDLELKVAEERQQAQLQTKETQEQILTVEKLKEQSVKCVQESQEHRTKALNELKEEMLTQFEAERKDWSRKLNEAEEEKKKIELAFKKRCSEMDGKFTSLQNKKNEAIKELEDENRDLFRKIEDAKRPARRREHGRVEKHCSNFKYQNNNERHIPRLTDVPTIRFDRHQLDEERHGDDWFEPGWGTIRSHIWDRSSNNY